MEEQQAAGTLGVCTLLLIVGMYINYPRPDHPLNFTNIKHEQKLHDAQQNINSQDKNYHTCQENYTCHKK
jgi:hypothetical protein